MVLPVDVRSDGSAHGDVAGPGRHRDEPACWDQVPHQLVQADAGADLDRLRGLVQGAQDD